MQSPPIFRVWFKCINSSCLPCTSDNGFHRIAIIRPAYDIRHGFPCLHLIPIKKILFIQRLADWKHIPCVIRNICIQVSSKCVSGRFVIQPLECLCKQVPVLCDIFPVNPLCVIYPVQASCVSDSRNVTQLFQCSPVIPESGQDVYHPPGH